MSEPKLVDARTLRKWLDDGEAILIDVREIDEYNEAHIPDSILIPVNKCSPDVLPSNSDKKIVFHCKSGPRSGRVCDVCAKSMPDRVVYNLDGGIEAWIKEGLEVQKVK